MLVNTPLVVKRIEDKTTKQPRLPVTAELLQKEVRNPAARPPFCFRLKCDVGRRAARLLAPARPRRSLSRARRLQMTKRLSHTE